MTKNHRFTMYQNIIYDEGQIINPFECMKLLNYFYDENIDLVKMNEQLREENKELKEINQDHQDHISLLEEEKINLQIKLQKIRDYAMEDGEVKQGMIERVILND